VVTKLQLVLGVFCNLLKNSWFKGVQKQWNL